MSTKKHSMHLSRTVITGCILLICSLTSRAENNSTAASPAIELSGLSYGSDRCLVFVSFQGDQKILSTIGAKIGPYELVAVDKNGTYADFAVNSRTLRVWLKNAKIASYVDVENKGPSNIEVPSIDKVKKLVITGNIPRNKVDSMVQDAMNRLINDPTITEEERQKRRERLLSGESPVIVYGPGGISEKEAKENGLDPDIVAKSKFMAEVGHEQFFKKKTEQQVPAEGTKKMDEQRPSPEARQSPAPK